MRCRPYGPINTGTVNTVKYYAGTVPAQNSDIIGTFLGRIFKAENDERG